jgi:hypothetical protein
MGVGRSIQASRPRELIFYLISRGAPAPAVQDVANETEWAELEANKWALTPGGEWIIGTSSFLGEQNRTCNELT